MNLMLPQPLVHTSARVLEFESLRDLLRGYASSPLGQARIARLAASRDQGWTKNQQQRNRGHGQSGPDGLARASPAVFLFAAHSHPQFHRQPQNFRDAPGLCKASRGCKGRFWLRNLADRSQTCLP